MSLNTSTRIIGLFDANSFYARCETIFRPDLWHKPVVALSNNNGCIVAQNPEAKAILEIWMCRPWFEVEEEADILGITAFSSNYELYGDMSRRFMQVLARFAPVQMIYSIDECFLEFTGMDCDIVALGHQIVEAVQQETGLKICAGFGHTMTEAKYANHCAKKLPHLGQVCDLISMPQAEIDNIMESMPVSKVWGVGSRLEDKLTKVGIMNVLRLKHADPKRIRDKFGVLLERTIRELNGECWLSLDKDIPEAKQVMSSRSFGARVDNITHMTEAVSFHAALAAERMRERGLYAVGIYVFIQNSPFDQADYYFGTQSIRLPSPTNCSKQITKTALWLLRKVFREGVYYQKCGVMLMELVPEEGRQQDLLGYSHGDAEDDKLMQTFDSLNKRYGRGTIKLGSEGTQKVWTMNRSLKSPNYTTNASELPIARA